MSFDRIIVIDVGGFHDGENSAANVLSDFRRCGELKTLPGQDVVVYQHAGRTRCEGWDLLVKLFESLKGSLDSKRRRPALYQNHLCQGGGMRQSKNIITA